MNKPPFHSLYSNDPTFTYHSCVHVVLRNGTQRNIIYTSSSLIFIACIPNNGTYYGIERRFVCARDLWVTAIKKLCWKKIKNNMNVKEEATFIMAHRNGKQTNVHYASPDNEFTVANTHNNYHCIKERQSLEIHLSLIEFELFVIIELWQLETLSRLIELNIHYLLTYISRRSSSTFDSVVILRLSAQYPAHNAFYLLLKLILQCQMLKKM